MTELTHLSLFSGIGGLDLAAEWAGFKTVGQVEYAEYPRKVLERHWKEVPRWKDVRQFTADEFIRRTGQKEVTVLSGGFPCQPHSVAGKRLASADERDLWEEMRRIICEIRPKWVVAENVRGLLSSESGRFFGRVLRDFSDMGFDVGWSLISAAEVGAIHRRERVAIVAHDSGKRVERLVSEAVLWEQVLQRCEMLGEASEFGRRSAIFECKLCRANDGLSHWMDRLKCLGNSVVPQQFFPVFSAIAEIERSVSSA